MIPTLLVMILFLSSCADNPNKESNFTPSRGQVKTNKHFNKADDSKYKEIKDDLLNKRYVVAEAKLQPFLVKYPNLGGPLANMGLIYSETNRLNEAEKILVKASEIDPKNAQILLRLALVYKREGKIPESLDAYKRAIAQAPNNSKAHYNIAILYDIYLEDVQLAINHVEKYVELTGGKDETASIWLKQLKRDQNKAAKKGE